MQKSVKINKLFHMERAYQLATCYFSTPGEIMDFFMEANVELDGEMPFVLIANGKGQIVIDLLEDALLGHPS